MTASSTTTTPTAATTLARTAAALMLLSAAISAYWAAGGTGLLDTVGGTIERWGREGGTGVRLAMIVVVTLKLLGAWLPVRAVHPDCSRTIRRLAWLEAAILIIYGGVLTATELAAQVGLIAPGPHPDWKALHWHTYLWDPWFLIVGLLTWAALRSTARETPGVDGVADAVS